MKEQAISLARKSGALFLASSIATLFNFLFVFFLARLIGAEQYGYIPLARSSQLILEAFLELGLAAALIKRLSDSKDSQMAVIGTSLSLKLALGLASTLALIAVAMNSPAPMDIYLLAIAPFPLFSFAFSNMRSVYSSRMDAFKTSLLTILPDFLRFCIAIGLFFAGFGALSGILGFTLGMAISFIIAAGFLLKDRLLSFSFDLEEAKKQLFLGLFLNSQQLSTYFFPSIVTILSGVLLSIKDVSIIAVSMSFASLIYLFLSPITSFLYPFMCANHSNPKFKPFLELLIRYWLSVVLISLFALQFGSSFILGLVGKEYLAGSSIFIIIAAAIFFDSFKQISDSYLIAKNKHRLLVFFEGIKFLAFFGVLLYLFYSQNSFSLEGVAWAIFFSFAFSCLARLLCLSKEIDIKLFLLFQFLRTVIFLAVFYFLIPFGTGILADAIIIAFGCILLFLLGILNMRDFSYLIEIANWKSGENKAGKQKQGGKNGLEVNRPI